MTLTIPSTTIAQALKAAASIVETRNTIPILSMVRLVASKDTLEITTTNLDIEYRQTLACTVTEPFQCAVEAKRLASMAGAAVGDMTLTPGDGVLTIKAGRSRWSAPTLPVDDFPVMPVDKLGAGVKMDGEVLSRIIQRTVWSASDEATRYYLGGIYLNDRDGCISYVATNGHTLVQIETTQKWPKGAPDVIVPTGLLTAMSTSAQGQVKFEWDAGKLRMTVGDVTITGKMIDGSFPDYRRVIPAPSVPVAVDADELIGAVRRVRIASDAQTKKLRISRGDGLLGVRIEGTAGFEGSEEVVAECAASFESGVNADYLEGMLKALDAGSVTIEQEDPNKPFLMRPVAQKTGLNFTGVVMGMRI